ncbi:MULTISPECIES: YciI family protein [Prochlorococcus]|uniref:Uncharacterized YCII family conserved protein n=1 Tax=Prochlorococcus marinus (strain SARG / CCMP1375 / SS120) TaxID=167539 RepID=Q7VD13_PROMA|nr:MULTISPECIES: YciI family protein [Prochlorococcus]AAP99621.1 Uncharacterized YCII family conserved protein [Prochlorococcus marinus subsp. marinus str. CCMP1375]KGG11109.1 hypothetical protein EV04_1182 [Prochlorococcus marinus str. LG]KGG21447.1 hypothetical protein EV08_0532 [Prochlorococcus marinus str. SS2]KGG23208.1 hypothetical protein EV09_1956 [Prochlorococcus marinus str. SS35]KGG33919.1 hypothetical protein EV10_0358 [Prochlorococcus marinus str. SS51]
MDKFVLFGSYCENAIQKRVPFRDEHLSRLNKLKQEGILITLGPTKCNRYVFGVFEATSIDIVKKLLDEDVYWKEGIWTSLDIYPWTQAF